MQLTSQGLDPRRKPLHLYHSVLENNRRRQERRLGTAANTKDPQEGGLSHESW